MIVRLFIVFVIEAWIRNVESGVREGHRFYAPRSYELYERRTVKINLLKVYTYMYFSTNCISHF